MKTLAMVLGGIVLLCTPIALFAKGDTVRIMIGGETLRAPIEITNPTLVHQFHIWSGPGTSSNEAEGLNVDWSHGVVSPPKGLKSYNVSFQTGRSDFGTYVVRYAVDPVTGQGYVYIPGKSDGGYQNNTRLIYRGIEGNWFRASKAWQHLADRLIVKAAISH